MSNAYSVIPDVCRMFICFFLYVAVQFYVNVRSKFDLIFGFEENSTQFINYQC